LNLVEIPPAREALAAALLEQAKQGGAGAALAAKRAAVLAERSQPGLAREALAWAARLDPADPAPKLGLARLHAEAGDLDRARQEAEAVFIEATDKPAKARAAFISGEILRVQGDQAAARNAYAAALRLEDEVLAKDRSDPTAARWYARARGRLAELDASNGSFARARAGAEGALAMLRAAAAQVGEDPAMAADIADAEVRLAALELDDNQPASARRRLAEAIGRYEALAATEKEEPHWRAVLSDAWALAAEADYVRGAPEHARTAIDKALQARLRLAASHPEEAWALAGMWRVRAALLAALGDAGPAAESLQQARALAESLCSNAAGAEAPARFLVHTLLDQADHALRSGDLGLTRAAADSARGLAEAYARAADAQPAWFGDAGACWDRLGEVARAGGASAQAQDAFARAVEFRRMARDRAPQEPRFARGLAAALLKLGDAALNEDAHASARAAYAESVTLRLGLAAAAPKDGRTLHALAAALERLGLAARAVGDLAAARAAWEDELALADRIFPADDLAGVRFCAIVESHLAGVGGLDAENYRLSALARFDALAQAGMLTERETALRKQLWGRA